MRSLFSPDSKFMQAMSQIADLVLLNFVFLLCCVPVVTAGAAITALYTVCSRFSTPGEQSALRGFFRAFRENFRQSTILWLLLLILGGTACVNIWIFSQFSGVLSYGVVLFGILLMLTLMIGSYAFPLLGQFSNDIRSTFKNALFLSVGYLPRTILVTAVNVFPWVLLLWQPYLFFSTGFIWVAIYFSTGAYLNSLVLKKVFAPYLQNEEESL